MNRPRQIAQATAALLACAGAAPAQDSVANAPARNDALSAHDDRMQRAAYIVDLTPVVTSWGAAIGVAPILKASRGLDPFFNTQILGSTVISATHWAPPGGVTFPSRAYRLWTAPGPGVHPTANAGGSTLSRTSYERQFAVAASDHAFAASGVVGAIVGQDNSNLARLYVERTTALASRLVQSPPDDTGTVAAGAIDAAGFLAVRADDFGAASGFAGKVKGDNIALITLSGPNGRNTAPGQFAAVNAFINILSEQNQATDANATTFIVNNSATENATAGTFILPTIVPNPTTVGLIAPPIATLDLTHRLTNGATRALASTTSGAAPPHLAPGVSALRGPLSFGFATAAGNAGALAAIATTGSGSLAPASSINVAGVRFVANPLVAEFAPTPALATLPTPITGPAGYQANRTGKAEFSQFRSQTIFRGPAGLVGVGQTAPGAGGVVVIAATASDASANAQAEREFIAVKTLSGGSTTDDWSVAAHPNQPVLSGPGGVEIGRLAHALPASFSAPAVDLYGNVYFVSRWTESGSSRLRTGFFRAVPGPSGYELELLMSSGRTIRGRNSDTPYEIVALYLADEDSVASGAFHSGALLQSVAPGRVVSAPSSVFAFGGAVVNATIQYNRAGSIEEYDVALFVGPMRALAADANADGVVDFLDLNIVLSAFATSGPSAAPGDLNGDGAVDFLDLNLLLSQFGQAG